MIVRHAKDVARQWVLEEASQESGFCGAFFHGSTNWLPDDGTLPPTSDLDIMVVLADSNLPDKPGKFIYRNVLLEVSYLPQDQIQSPEMVLGQYHLAGSFKSPGIILDPSGSLTELQAAVAENYAKRQWVYKRCEQARNKVMYGFEALDETKALPDQVLAWLFPTGVTTHVLLVAGLKNPTVRKRYVAVRELLAEYGHLDLFDTLLEPLGCATMSRARVEHHLTALATVFDVAKTVVKTPFPFTSDISDVARPLAIDGTRDLIERGYHREAVFWLVATYSRCQKVLYEDAPAEMHHRFDHGYRQLLGELGVSSFADFVKRRELVTRLLPQVWEKAEAIIAANPELQD